MSFQFLEHHDDLSEQETRPERAQEILSTLSGRENIA
jgi:hypothetical protein